MNEQNNNTNGSSPLDELRKINERVKPGSAKQEPVRKAPAPQIRQSPAPRQVPAGSSAQVRPQNAQQTPAQRPRPVVRQAPQQNTAISHPVPVRSGNTASANAENGLTQKIDTDEILRITSRSKAETPEQRAASVRQARAQSMANARQSASATRSLNAVIADSAAKAPGTAPNAGTRGRPETHEKRTVATQEESTKGRGVITNTVKAVIYLVAVLVISGCLSLFIIFVGNDAFALVKDDTQIAVTIPEGSDLSDIAEILGENDVIKYPSMFKLYINLRHRGADKYLSGTFTVSPSMPYDELIDTFKESAAKRKEITITFTEGMTVDEIIDKFVENGIGTRERFIDVIQNYPFDYWFIEELDKTIAANPNSGRKYRLEGYLFPDTYNFYNNSKEEDALKRMLDNFETKFDENYRLGAQQLGMTVDEVVTLASIIQKEAKFVADYPIVSSVFHNRLDHPDRTDGKLESNATVQYTMPKEEVRLELTVEEIQKYDNAYNTYLYAGLPVGAICNPSMNAINFALYPQSTDYYYFISDSSGANLYARNWEEHARNRQKVEAEAGS